jgi:hypothetical protein
MIPPNLHNHMVDANHHLQLLLLLVDFDIPAKYLLKAEPPPDKMVTKM